MGRPRRVALGGWVYHVLNRANARLALFERPDDYAAFERILVQGIERYRPRLLAYCLMPNHWHLLLWPEQDDVLSQFVGWVTLTHTQRLHVHRGTVGGGHIYQGRFKSFPVQEDEHFYAVARYVERNALRAGLVSRAEEWRWSSLADHSERSAANSDEASEPQLRDLLSKWPVSRPSDWRRLVNRGQTEAELAALRRSLSRGVPYGGPRWTKQAAAELELDSTLRPRGRPRKGA